MKRPRRDVSANGLIAVLLITRSRPGPKLVFHYPPEKATRQTSIHYDVRDDSDSDSDAEDEAFGGLDRQHSEPLYAGKHALEATAENPAGSSLHDRVLGYSTETLEKLLSPGRWSDRKKFEVCLDGITFVGRPVHALENGEWSSKGDGKPLRDGQGHMDAALDTAGDNDSQHTSSAASAQITITQPDNHGPAHTIQDFTHIPDSFESQNGLVSMATSMNSTSTTSAAPIEDLQMFHVVFALARSDSISGVYEHVAKTLTAALKYCQKQSNYVATESRTLLALRAKAKQAKTSPEELSKQMVEASELAWALRELHDKLSADEVAGIRLCGMEMSLRCPLQQGNDNAQETSLDALSGLLLLEEKDELLRRLQHPDASPLAYFLREHTPTKSLQKQADLLKMPVKDMILLASHLIKWRKARAISPLHSRNTYVVRLEAPLSKTPELIPTYSRRFPALPPLPQILKVLSGRPIKYGLMIPSKDHRGPYMDILAYLHRHEFVVQLKTYGWLKVSKAGDSLKGIGDGEPLRRPTSGLNFLSPRLRPFDEDAASVSSEKTAVTVQTAVPTGDGISADIAADETVILDPTSPSNGEAESLRRLRASLIDRELRENFERLLPYFDGEHALEAIAAREGLKRSRVEDWLDLLEKRGHLMVFRGL